LKKGGGPLEKKCPRGAAIKKRHGGEDKKKLLDGSKLLTGRKKIPEKGDF